ncbi:putative HemS domain-containing protein [Hyphomicrobiales bacterium]|nr:putative HemS domain-containing protein [Hyphomicrobiales bacterium]CAH1666520.1 putative HemS domain-containing protein [Hyphomicrobiales bacterium]
MSSVSFELQHPPFAILSCLARLPVIQAVVRHDGVAHELFMPLEKLEGNTIIRASGSAASGAACGFMLATETVRSVVFSTILGLNDTYQPKIDWVAADGGILLSILGLDGEQAFLDVLAPLTRRRPSPAPRVIFPEGPAVAPDDPVAIPIREARDAGGRCEIRFEGLGAATSWSGRLRALTVGPQYINVIQDDMHLHLLGGAINQWKSDVRPDSRTFHASTAHGHCKLAIIVD